MSDTAVEPDAASRDELLCPLCDYSLRGLEHPRCPECGHQFDWEELIDRRARLHPFLFEHHPKRNLWSLAHTLAASGRPLRFWRTVRPVQTPVPRRAILYHAIVLLIACAATGVIGRYSAGIVHYMLPIAQRWDGQRRMTAERKAYLTTAYGSVSQYFNAFYPPPPPLWRSVRAWSGHPYWMQSVILPLLAAIGTWAGITLLTLLIFRASMRQAQIHVGHAVRCVVYSADAILWMPLLVLVSAAAAPWVRLALPVTLRIVLTEYSVAVLLMLAVGGVALTIRLWIAYRAYLRFPHALATVIASQIIVGLIYLKLYALWTMP